jgi:predicted O-methyltransferase YrrM
VPEFVKMSIRVSSVIDMGLPEWMTPFAQQIFGIPTHMTPSERLMLVQVALGLPQDFVVVEIGSYLGASTAFLAAAATQRNGCVHAVDTWMNNAMGAEGEYDTWSEFRTNTAAFAERITTHRGTSLEVHGKTGGIACDMLFVDGDHQYEGVANDLRLWLPSLRAGGVLAMHDFDQPGVCQALADVVGTQFIDRPKTIDRLMICRPHVASATATKA